MNCPVRLIAWFILLAVPTLGQDMSKTVLPISQSRLMVKKSSLPSSLGWSALVPKVVPALGTEFGTGFCVDPDCRLIGTNYHFAADAWPRKLNGENVVQRYLATGPDDEGATLNDVFSEHFSLKYTLIRDLAIYELRHPIRDHHGLTFSLDDLEIGQQVDIYAYPKEFMHPIRSLEQFHGEFRGTISAGLLAFEYVGKQIRGGASGGLVVDSKTRQVVGILSRVGLGKDGKAVALAVPIDSLADFIRKVQPWIAPSLFPSAKNGAVSPAAADLYPKFVWPPAGNTLQRRPEEPADVKLLRKKAQDLADSIRNFVAVQTFAWGSGENKVPVAEAAYEVQVLDGFQRFREYPEGKQESQNVPFPPVNTMVVPGGEWSELPQMVGTELKLKIHQAPDTVVNGHPVKVFQYRADAEDGVCSFKSVRDYGFFEASKIVTIPCHGEVWTDDEMNILRISQHLELAGKWKDYQSVVTYGWLQRADVPRLVPLTISTQAEFKNKKVYWCHGNFTDYRVFSTETRIVANEQKSATDARPGLPQ
jgi:trypsin-like peptidase